MSAPVTVLIAHSQPQVRLIWRAVLSPHCGRYHIKGEAATTDELLHAAACLQPDVVLMDAGIAGKCIAATAQQVRACAANAKLLICWQYCHERLVQQIPGLPVAYLAEDAPPVEMLFAIKELMRGNIYHCRQTERLLSPQCAVNRLPEKYRQLLWCMRQGHTAKDMAMATGLKPSTVRGYVKEIYALIGSRSMGALESFMKKEGIL